MGGKKNCPVPYVGSIRSVRDIAIGKVIVVRWKHTLRSFLNHGASQKLIPKCVCGVVGVDAIKNVVIMESPVSILRK